MINVIDLIHTLAEWIGSDELFYADCIGCKFFFEEKNCADHAYRIRP